MNNLSAISDATSDPREEDWPTEGSFKLASDFSDSMFDHVSDEYQSKEIVKATGDTSDDSDSRAHTTQWLRQLPQSFTPAANIRDTMKEWPNSNRAQSERGTGCSKTQNETGMLDTASRLIFDTTEEMKQMSFGVEWSMPVIDYKKPRLPDCLARAAKLGFQQYPRHWHKLQPLARVGNRDRPRPNQEHPEQRQADPLRTEQCRRLQWPVNTFGSTNRCEASHDKVSRE